jgi:hypothetical protein
MMEAGIKAKEVVRIDVWENNFFLSLILLYFFFKTYPPFLVSNGMHSYRLICS